MKLQSSLLSALCTVCVVAVVGLGVVACTDTPAPDGGDEQNDQHNDNNDPNGNNDNTTPDPNSGDNDNDNAGDNNDNNNDNDPTCVNYQCRQVDCPDGQTTSLSGTVHIPSGELPIPNVSVYVPNEETEPIETGASCQRCDEMHSGAPLVATTTDYDGTFELTDVPVGEQIPLVIQTGKWRRQIEVSTVEECQDNPLGDDKTRLPRNRNEGDIPSIAVTTGSWDALECLTFDIGLDHEEYTGAGGDGAVTIFDNGGADGFSAPLGEENFTEADIWWNNWEDDPQQLEQFDMMLFSCSGSIGDPELLEEYVDQGGRVFMTDLQRSWLEDGTENFQDVAEWGSENTSWPDEDGIIDTSFVGGQTMHNWLDGVGALDAAGYLPLKETTHQVDTVDDQLGTRWIYSEQADGSEQPHYFAFYTPVGADEAQQCGRVVYSDLHVVAADDDVDAGGQFPDNCGFDPDDPSDNTEMSGQEQALMYMLFDLSGCVEPECADLQDSCQADADCCKGLWCDEEINECTDRCRNVGERCTRSADCCTEACGIIGGEDQGECVAP